MLGIFVLGRFCCAGDKAKRYRGFESVSRHPMNVRELSQATATPVCSGVGSVVVAQYSVCWSSPQNSRFERIHCPACERVHDDVFAAPGSRVQLARINMVQFDIWSKDTLTIPSGERTTARACAARPGRRRRYLAIGACSPAPNLSPIYYERVLIKPNMPNAF